jgi:uncharacterized protein
MFDRNGLEVLDRTTCLQLLSSATVGRLALTIDALPVIVPVNFVVADDKIVLRTGEGAKLRAALRRNVVALEVDAVHPMDHSGWSVLVQGNSRVVTEPDELAWAASLPLLPWANDSADHYVVITTDVVQGRRLVRVEHPAVAAR